MIQKYTKKITKRPVNKMIEIPGMSLAFKAISYENNKYYLQIFLMDECLNKL